MKKVKAFFYVFLKSLVPQKKYYHQITKTNFVFSLKYFIFLVFFLNFIFVIKIASLYNYIDIKNFLYDLQKTLKSYPKDLRFFITNRLLFSNTNKPYFMWIGDGEKKRLLVSFIETVDEQTINNLPAVIIFTKEKLIIKNPNDYQVAGSIPYTKIAQMEINKNQTKQLIQSINDLNKRLLLYYLLLILITFASVCLISYTFISVYLLMASFLVYSFFKFIKHRHFHYKKVFQISLHAITFPLTLEYLVVVLPVNLFYLRSNSLTFSFFFLPSLIILIFALFTFIGILEAYNNHHNLHSK